MILRLIPVLTVLLFLLYSCGSEPQTPTTASTKSPKAFTLIHPIQNQVLTFGKDLNIQIDYKNDGAALLDSVIVYYEDRRLGLVDLATKEYAISAKNLALGFGKIIVKGFKKDGEQENKWARVKILSDLKPIEYTYKTVASYPHDKSSYTQGLLIEDGIMYESTGQRGLSQLLQVDVETGEKLKELDLEKQFFGEGLCSWEDDLIQLSWTAGTGFVYDKNDFSLKTTFSYSGEGWGICSDEEHLIMSNGSNELVFLDPNTFKEVRNIYVMDDEDQVDRLNELEYVNGEIWANIYDYNVFKIVRLDPDNGRVKGVIDLSGMVAAEDVHATMDVLNGIAYDQSADRLFVTGKNYAKLYEIQVFASEK